MFTTALELLASPQPDMWQVVTPLTWKDYDFGTLTVPAGFETDLASTPFHIADNGPARRPAAVHDWLYGSNEGRVFGKPRSADDARHMLENLSGRTHSVLTGVSLIRLPDAQRLQFVETTLVHFAPLDPEEISRYLATGEPHDKAGGYAIQGRAGRYIPRIEGDYFNIVGLPLARVTQALAELGWSED